MKMAEYIEREATLQIIDYAKQRTIEHIVREIGAYESLSDTGKVYYDSIITTLDMCKHLIKEAVKTADVQPIRRGRWIEADYGMFYECSECGNIKEFERDFCDICGADMREPKMQEC